MAKKTLTLTFGEKVISFKFEEFDDNLDIDKLLKIDYENLVAEILTFPVVVNKLGLLAADMDNELQQAKLNLAIYEAKRKNELREELQQYDDNGKPKRAPGVDEVESAMQIEAKWKIMKKKIFKADKEKEYIYSVYSSAKDKSNKLDKLSLTVKTGDIDDKIIQKQLNNVYFKMKDGKIKGAE